MDGFEKLRHNPIELIKNFWPWVNVEHIEYDPNLRKGEYDIIRQCGGDGTLLFTQELLQSGLVNIVNGVSFCTKNEPDWKRLKKIKYTVGTMRHAVVIGKIKLGCSKKTRYHGQKERIRMPVKCEYIYK